MATALQPEEKETSDYYDILLLGRTGQGKSTAGNKLLKSDNPVHTPITVRHPLSDREVGGEARGEDEQRAEFKVGADLDSVTDRCELISNETTNTRILDTPGFADSRTAENGVFNGNLEVFRDILRVQEAKNLAFSRVLYFFPLRGRPTRADGHLQEELKLMYGFLGEDVFKIMVIVATNDVSKNGKQDSFDDDDKELIKQAFMKAFNKITGKTNVLEECPPVLYLPLDEKNLMDKVVQVEVIYEKPLTKPETLEISLCKPSIIEAKRRNKGIKLLFCDRCIKCSGKLIYEDTSKGKKPIRIVLNEGSENEKVIPYGDSKCHPLLLPEHFTVTKIVGGIAHIVTFGIFVGIGKIRGKKMWPGFTNHDEYCVSCKGPPSAKGCTRINRKFEVKTKNETKKIPTTHSTTLDELQIDDNE